MQRDLMFIDARQKNLIVSNKSCCDYISVLRCGDLWGADALCSANGVDVES